MPERRYPRSALARDLPGVPLLPPGGVTHAMVKISHGAGGRAPEVGSTPGAGLEGLFGLIDNRVLGLLVELNLPELLDKPRSSAILPTSPSSPSRDKSHRGVPLGQKGARAGRRSEDGGCRPVTT